MTGLSDFPNKSLIPVFFLQYTLRTNSFNHKRYRAGLKSFRQLNLRHMNILKTE